jgi:hypothetical protein
LGLAYSGFIGCGSSDEKRDVRREVGGAGGEAGEPTSGAQPTGGSSGTSSSGGSSVIPPLGGFGGELAGSGGAGGAVDTGGASETGGAGGEADRAGEGGGGGESGGCVPTQGSRITLGFDASNGEWVNDLKWLDSAGMLTENLAAWGGSSTCSEPSEFFGESYGAPEGTTPGVVVAGSRATRSTCGLDVLLASTPNNCTDAPQLPWTTEYHFYSGAKASQLRVTRSFGFDENTPKYTGVGLRPWQARVPLGTFGNVIYPNAASTAVTRVGALSCPGDCLYDTAQWNGQWFADVAASGLALIVRRDPSMTAPVSLTINYDSYSYANLSSFVLIQPESGWKAPVTEVEYLCFADLTSWPQAERDAAELPAFCGP